MSEHRWTVVTTYASGFEADMAVEQLTSAGILAVRRDNDTVGLFGPGFQGASARGVDPLMPFLPAQALALAGTREFTMVVACPGVPSAPRVSH